MDKRQEIEKAIAQNLSEGADLAEKRLSWKAQESSAYRNSILRAESENLAALKDLYAKLSALPV